MSTETLQICDVQECGQVASCTLDHVTVAVWDINQRRNSPCVEGEARAEDGLHIWTSIGVDLCGAHEHFYRSNLPTMKLNQMKDLITK